MSWGIIEVADILIGVLELPDWTQRLILVILIIGIVPALVAAWALELTPDGLRLDRSEEYPESWPKQSALKLHRFIIGGLVVVIMLLLVERVYFAEDSSPSEPMPGAPQEEQSVAVLPFNDFSRQQDQRWFADGLSEEIINALARLPDIMVAAGQTAMLYRDSEKDVSTIGREMGVAHVLEGSVRATDDTVRVSAQLIRVNDGFHVWSQTYDRPLEDVIAIQEDMALQIATALETTLSPNALDEMVEVGTRSVRAYRAYIEGISSRLRSFRTSDWTYYLEAYGHFERAREFDPKFSAAHRRAAEFWLIQMNPARRDNGLTDLDVSDMHRLFMERIDLAIETAKSEAERSGSRAQRSIVQLRLRNALRRLSEQVEARPNDLKFWADMLLIARIANDRALIEQSLDTLGKAGERHRVAAARYVTAQTHLGSASEAAEYGLRALQQWPNDAGISYQTHRALLWAMRIEEAGLLLSNSDPAVSGDLLARARQACAEGRRDDVLGILGEFQQLQRRRPVEEWLVLKMLDEPGQVQELLLPYADSEVPFQLASWLTYPSFDPSPYPFLMQMLERENIDRPPVSPIPFACPANAVTL